MGIKCRFGERWENVLYNVFIEQNYCVQADDVAGALAQVLGYLVSNGGNDFVVKEIKDSKDDKDN